MSSHHCKDCKQKHSLFTDILKARKMKLQRQKRMIDRVLQDKIRKIPQLNPEKKFRHDHPALDSLEHYSDSQFSITNDDYKISISRRPQPKRPPTKKQQIYQLSEEQILNERAKQFINRLRKQKQYNEGKLLLMRKRQQEKRELQEQIRNVQRKSLDLVYKKQKINKLMDSILVHEGKISERAAKSLKKDLRSKTENYDRDELTKSLILANDPVIYSIRKRVKQLSDMIETYQ